ncbi:hypothetical protein [Streptomyces sp. NPDC021020]|uniref:hypothetical protein n=1 Tax=Streptomyces sp. NPDC021020 TaxID=3365109 RepID=UPI00378C618A
MDVRWGSLAEVAVVSFGATVAVVLVFALGVRALTGRAADRTAGQGGPARAVAAGACFAVCAAAVAYGLYLIVPHSH